METDNSALRPTRHAWVDAAIRDLRAYHLRKVNDLDPRGRLHELGTQLRDIIREGTGAGVLADRDRYVLERLAVDAGDAVRWMDGYPSILARLHADSLCRMLDLLAAS